MKTCSLNSFLQEIGPWLDNNYIHKAISDGKGNFILHFLDGTKHSYAINDCNKKQVDVVISDLKAQGIKTKH